MARSGLRMQWGCKRSSPKSAEYWMIELISNRNDLMVPRGGIEPSPIQLKVHHFSNDDVPVYLPVDPALSSRPGGCDSVPPYPSRARVTRYTKDIISAVCCAQMQIGTRP
jgi:hypothetical protein